MKLCGDWKEVENVSTGGRRSDAAERAAQHTGAIAICIIIRSRYFATPEPNNKDNLRFVAPWERLKDPRGRSAGEVQLLFACVMLKSVYVGRGFKLHPSLVLK